MEAMEHPMTELSLTGDAFEKRHGRRKRLATLTLGCKVNQYETQALIELFQQAGFDNVSSEEMADVVLINTCTVTSMSDRKSRQFIRRARKLNPQAIVAVAGCYAQLSPEEVRRIEGIQVIAGTTERHRLVDAVQYARHDQKHPIVLVKPHEAGEIFEPLTVQETNDMTRAYVKIQDGCNQYCSYCIIPYARGPVRSRPSEAVISEIQKLVANGYQEVVLTGIHLASYGKEQGEPDALIRLLISIDQMTGLKRLRLGSLEPTLITTDFTEKLMMLQSLCHHFHLSLQSGSNQVLRGMNRRYDTLQYRKAVELIRQYDPEAAITTDIIVGFPGETEAHFQETLDFVSDIQFADIHVFRYSPREGTPAAAYPQQVDEPVKHERSQRLSRLAALMKEAYLKQLISREVMVLMEKPSTERPDMMEGHTGHYVRVLAPLDEASFQRIIRVKIHRTGTDSCEGIVV
ncbi:tRNA (N(6)-L-threonylcarbamoyladenosine(37)-C(2))-methylthiotransferase MtaB [Anoxynatronum buryatiense]|uniref:Threonylcarbamoyladenosine tRNA methylthiotransferase MtaB n=1 Tax=Anoxynatronum buryatiense TaxID=489973 RepID=A0AA45WSX6_9CLOT|nr:tRNA (N(6)-L-threonylcarbamoyladenosine(37)-C(2))-methylthiotransferase MtaB [Anoxynatronum buryatiense]SMP39541.1 threonylcarbamoyladenosine tRNA methylthiotransferase MtaB [Anoxynatronum buryatiense]